MLIQLSQPIPMTSPLGKCLAHFLLDYSIEHDLFWIVFQDDTGECWTWNNKDIRAQKNITIGRTMKENKTEKELKNHEKKDEKLFDKIKKDMKKKKK